MSGYNKVILIGNLTRDPELRYTPKGVAIAKIGLAVNRQWKNEAGEKKEECVFVDVDSFGRQAETLAQYLKKGSPLMVEGRLKLDEWDDKATGQKRSRLGVVLEGFQFIGGKGDSEPLKQSDPRLNRPKAEEPGPTSNESDSVPF